MIQDTSEKLKRLALNETLVLIILNERKAASITHASKGSGGESKEIKNREKTNMANITHAWIIHRSCIDSA